MLSDYDLFLKVIFHKNSYKDKKNEIFSIFAGITKKDKTRFSVGSKIKIGV
jgi:hypothetical protein